MKRVRAPNRSRNCPTRRASTTRSFYPRPATCKTRQELVRPSTTSTKQPSKDDIFIFSRAPTRHGRHNHTGTLGPSSKGFAHAPSGARWSSAPQAPRTFLYLISTMRGAGDTKPPHKRQSERNDRPKKTTHYPKDHVKRCLQSGSVISVRISRTLRSETVVEAWTVAPDPGAGFEACE